MNIPTTNIYVIDLSTVSKNGLNPLGISLRNYIIQELDLVRNNTNIQAIIITGGKHSNFSAGADLTEFNSIQNSLNNNDNNNGNNTTLTLTDIVNLIEAYPKPIIAAINGVALGGGLELALACHIRIATATSKLGLPEVNVGVIPGAGGTQRLPRLIGLQQATQMILTGKPITASQAYSYGLIDDIVPAVNTASNLLEIVIKYVQQNVLKNTNYVIRRISQLSISENDTQVQQIMEMANKSIPIPEKGGFVQHCALKALQATTTGNFEDGMQVEGEQFLIALTSLQGQARRHVFFAIRQAQKPITKPTSSDIQQQHPLLTKSKTSPPPLTAVIGAGTMGSGIALVLLQAGYEVTLVDINETALKKGLMTIKTIVEKSYVKRKKMSPKHAQVLLKRLSSTTNLQSLTKVQLVIEAVVERMDIKQNIFETLDKVTNPSCILLSNTSTLNIDIMASALKPTRRQTFAGLHFFSPAHVMKLVEIVRGKETSTQTILLLQALTKRIGKLGVVVGNCDGFVGNRMLKPYGRESGLLLAEGNATRPEQVDQALTSPNLLGMSMGVFAMGDLAGNDIEYYIRQQRGWVRKDVNSPIPPGRPDRYTELADDMVSKLGRLGQKVGKVCFYVQQYRCVLNL